jgi:hypothetical protein
VNVTLADAVALEVTDTLASRVPKRSCHTPMT